MHSKSETMSDFRYADRKRGIRLIVNKGNTQITDRTICIIRTLFQDKH